MGNMDGQQARDRNERIEQDAHDRCLSYAGRVPCRQCVLERVARARVIRY